MNGDINQTRNAAARAGRPTSRWRPPGWRLAALACCAWMLPAHADTGWRTLPADEARLALRAPGLESVTPRLQTREEGWVVSEIGEWRARNSTALPRAWLVLLRLKDVIRQNRTFVRTKSLEEWIRAEFAGATVSTDGDRRIRNELGDIDYRRFRLAGSECVFVEQGISTFADQIEVMHGHTPLGDIVIRGWYCADPGSGAVEPAISAFLAGIGVRGFWVPPRQ